MSLRTAFDTFRGRRELHLDIIGRKWWWLSFSGLLVLVSIYGLVGPGLNLSVDFRGGAVIRYLAEEPVTAEDVSALVEAQGIDDATVQIIDGEEITVRTPTLEPDQQSELITELAGQAGIEPAEFNIESVSPTWGSQISRKALQGLIIFLILVSLYISFRFEWKMAAGALTTLVHDLLISAGVYALVGREVTPETVIAILTIMGYSLYDTVVIFDKIKENTENLALVNREGYSRSVNLSVNQVFWRSVNTSITTLFPILALLLFGGETLKDFAFALFVGILLGAYSSPFVAAPILTILKERETKYRQISDRLNRPGRTRPAPSADSATTRALQAAGVVRQRPSSAGGSSPAGSTSARPSGGSRPKRAGQRKPKRRRR